MGRKPITNGTGDMTFTNEEVAHDWHSRKVIDRMIQVCKRCGNVRRADDKNSPCKGTVKVTTR